MILCKVMPMDSGFCQAEFLSPPESGLAAKIGSQVGGPGLYGPGT